MTFRHSVWTIVFVGLCAASGYAGYYVYNQVKIFNAQMALDAQRAELTAQNRNKLKSALATAGVDTQQISRGFWYNYTDAYGNQSVGYVDVDSLAQQDPTEAQIKTLTGYVSSSTIVDRSAMHSVAEKDLPPELQFHNQLYTPQAPGKFQGTQTELERIYHDGTATAEQLWQLAYMYELTGDYSARDAVNAASCTKYHLRCKSDAITRIHGVVQDLSGRPVQGARVKILSHPEVSAVTSDAKGAYTIAISAQNMEKMRISAMKRNFSEGVASIIVLSTARKDYTADKIVLGSVALIVTIDTEKHTVTDPNDAANPDGSFVLRATSSAYTIPAGAIVHANGTPYVGAVDVYLYEFDKNTVPSSLITLDTFDSIVGFAGNAMKTLGMPYIQFFSPSGEELHVMKKKPMQLTYRLSGMDDLWNNTYNLPEGKLTVQDMQTLIAASAGDPSYPITSQWMMEHKLLTFPPFWVFDRRKGVWENVGMRVLDQNGTIQVPFYTINGN